MSSDSNLPDVAAIAGDLMSIVMDDGEVLPVTNWLCDEDEVPVDHPDGISALVAGPTVAGRWVTVFIADFDFDKPNQ